MKNWKTTVAGILVAAVGFCTYQQYISIEAGVSLLAFFGAIGLGVAKDNNVTGV